MTLPSIKTTRSTMLSKYFPSIVTPYERALRNVARASPSPFGPDQDPAATLSKSTKNFWKSTSLVPFFRGERGLPQRGAPIEYCAGSLMRIWYSIGSICVMVWPSELVAFWIDNIMSPSIVVVVDWVAYEY